MKILSEFPKVVLSNGASCNVRRGATKIELPNMNWSWTPNDCSFVGNSSHNGLMIGRPSVDAMYKVVYLRRGQKRVEHLHVVDEAVALED